MSSMVEYINTGHGKTLISNRDGIAWHEAPIPSRLHRCSAQTEGWFDWFTLIQRCACGAVRYADLGRKWHGRNSRRAT